MPTPLGGTPPRNPNLTGNCQILAAPAGLGYDFLVRFFGNTPQSPATQAVTIRIKGVEQVICPTEGTDGATLTTLGKRRHRSGADEVDQLHAPKGLAAGRFRPLRRMAPGSGPAPNHS